MEQRTDMSAVLKKIEELRAFLKFGDEIFPFISELFLFIQDIIPLMVKINHSIKDSTNRLPTATDNIISVSEVTESATQRVMDKLDIIMAELDDFSAELDGKPHLEKRVQRIQNEVSGIMYALQFQDITTQQLEHVNRILQAIYEKFTGLFDSILGVKQKTKVGGEILSAIEKEMKASDFPQESKQFQHETEDKVRLNGISQEDIDRLFNS